MELGNVEFDESRYAEARKCFEGALEIFRKHANRTGEGQVLGSLGSVYRIQGQYDRAISQHTQALAIAEKSATSAMRAPSRQSRYRLPVPVGQYDEAIAHYTQAIAIARGRRQAQ